MDCLFVVQLVGEYVIEILHVIANNIQNLDTKLYREFLVANRAAGLQLLELLSRRYVLQGGVRRLSNSGIP